VLKVPLNTNQSIIPGEGDNFGVFLRQNAWTDVIILWLKEYAFFKKYVHVLFLCALLLLRT